MVKRINAFFITVACGVVLASCGGSSDQGQLVGAYSNSNYVPPSPYGMVYVPTGILHSGISDEDMLNQYDAPARTTQIRGFYMDDTEISNAEYRQFTNWVRDSIVHTLMGDFDYDDLGNQMIDWTIPIEWEDEDVIAQIGSAVFLPQNISFSGTAEIDPTKLVYSYKSFDYNSAVKDPTRDRTDFVKDHTISVYPDTTVWARMFSYSYNDPMVVNYNNARTFDEYPVVGVTYHQAEAFCNWRTQLWRGARTRNGEDRLESNAIFKLPTEEQWEWAARGGRKQAPFPWGGPFIVNKKGCYLANFKPNRGNYSSDGGLYTVKVTAYTPNDYGLYNMSGNVSEWTSSSYFNNSSAVVDDMNPTIRYDIKDTDPLWMKRKVIRGGSWKDVAYYLQVSTRDYEFADTAKAYIGFRCIIDFIEPSLFNTFRRE